MALERSVVLEPIAEGLWSTSRPLRFLGLELGTRMTVVRLAEGGLFVHSPVALDAATREAVDALGPVTAIVAPCLFHHLFVGDWAKAYPNASVSACPGLERKRKDVAWSRVLGDEPADEWRGTLEQVLVSAMPMQNEVVFFHPKTQTLVTSDLVFDLASHPSPLTRAAGWLLGGGSQVGPTIFERFMMERSEAGRGQIARIVAWGAERIVLAHGGIVERGGSEVVRKGYAWI